MERLLTSADLPMGGERRRVYYGYDNQSPFSSGQYRTGLLTEGESVLRPAPGGADRPALIIVNRNSALPASAIPLQALGRAQIIFQGDPRDAGLGETAVVPLGEGAAAQVRLSEPVLADGTSARLQPDLVLQPGASGSDAALDSALARVRRFRPSSVVRPALPATLDVRPDRSYASMTSPALAYRLLGAFRLWNTIEYFYPYKDLLDDAWDAVLPTLIRDFATAADSISYARAVARAAGRLHDGHAYVAGGAYGRDLVGEGFPPIRVRWIEKKPVVTALYDTAAARQAGIAVGDVVRSVDGEDAIARIDRYAAFFSGSTPQGLMDKVTLSFMNGPVNSVARLVLRRRDGSEHETTIPRRREDYTTLYHRERDGEVLRLLPGNIGYVDLDRLGYDMVDSLFQRFRTTRAIIFDMRGYPEGTVWAIAPRLTDRVPVAALFGTPLPGHEPASSLETFAQRIDSTPPGHSLYRGRTLMLMDERSQSQAEHTGLFLKAANGTVLVGSPTSGADGEITSVTLPGGLTVGFTGQSVTWPDGRQVQRVGLVPDVSARPTLRGIQQGRDEVLEAALRYLGVTTH